MKMNNNIAEFIYSYTVYTVYMCVSNAQVVRVVVGGRVYEIIYSYKIEPLSCLHFDL